jgi:biotin carboxylase
VARPTLAVVYERGAVTTADLAVLTDLADLAFVVPESDYTVRLQPVLAELGDVVTLSGDLAADVSELDRVGPAGIVTFSDPMLRQTADLAAGLGLDYHAPDTTLLLTDKFRQRDRLAAAGVDAVRCRRVTSADQWWPALEQVGLPAVVKPAWGAGSRDAFPVPDEAAARRLAGHLFAGGRRADMVVEEYLAGRDLSPAGDYVSVESVCAGTAITHLAVTGKFPLDPPFREVGQYWPAIISPPDEAAVLALTTDALRALGAATGFLHTEIKLGPAGPRIIEVNGRIAGDLHQYAAQACSVDLVRAACQLALGTPVQVEPLRHPGVFFQYTSLGPTRPCRLVSVEGGRAVRAVDGIAGYRSVIRPGQRLDGGVMTDPLDFLWGHAASHDEMFEVLDRALAALCFEFAYDDGTSAEWLPPRPWAARD